MVKKCVSYGLPSLVGGTLSAILSGRSVINLSAFYKLGRTTFIYCILMNMLLKTKLDETVD